MSEQVKNPEQMKKNRKVILGIFGIPVLVLLLSTALYYLVESETVDLGTVNNGELIVPPLEFNSLTFSTSTGEIFDYSKPEPKWAYVIIGDQHCRDSCERMLYIARQSIVALAKRMNRVRLIYISTDGAISEALQQRFDREYHEIDVLFLSNSELEGLFNGSNFDPLAKQTFFVVDPMGWLMMQYRIENTEQETLNALGKATVRDMKRLIK